MGVSYSEYDMESHCHLQSGNPALLLQRKKLFETKKCKMVKNQDPCTDVMKPETYVFGTICSVGQLNDALFTKLVGKAGCRKNRCFCTAGGRERAEMSKRC